MIATLLVTLLFALSAPPPQQAYLLDHPIDENLLILTTQDGRFPIALLSAGCQWVHSDMNVQIDQVQDVVVHISAGPSDRYGDLLVAHYGCVVAIGDRVDATPCFANAAGDCDIDAGEHYWPDS